MGRLILRGTSSGATDTTPNAFSFTDQTSVALSTVTTSAPVTISGINAPASITVTGGTYDINSSGSFTSSAGSISNGNTVRARHTSSASNSASTNTVVTIGGVSDTFTSVTLASGGGSATGDIFNDTFEDRTAQSVITLTSAWTSKGYTDGSDTKPTMLDRSGMPAWLLADPRMIAGKTRCIRFNLTGNEEQSRILWERAPGTREWYVSFWEGRDSGGLGGEKFVRIGNKSGASRGHDIILTYGVDPGGNPPGTPPQSYYIPNSALMQQTGQEVGYGSVLPLFNQVLRHVELRCKLSTSTNSDGIFQCWIDGTQVFNTTNIRFNRDSTDAARDLELFDMGGWSSTGSLGPSGNVNYPIARYWPGGVKISSTRLGVWDITT